MARVDEVSVQASWNFDPFLVPSAANQILIQPGLSSGGTVPDGFYVSLGHLTPPAFPNAEAAQAALRNGDQFPIVPLVRVHVSRERLTEFARIIGEALEHQVEAAPALLPAALVEDPE